MNISIRKLGAGFIITGAILIPVMVWLLFGGIVFPTELHILVYLTVLMIFHLGFAFLYLQSQSVIRRKRAFLFLILALLFFSVGMWCKYNRIIGAGLEVMTGVFIFCFSFLPLVIKNRYEKWRGYTQSAAFTLLLCMGDLVSVVLLLLGALSKFQHWPVWTVLVIFGALLFIITFVGWNRVFKNEVRLRKQTEDTLRVTLDDLNNKHKVIEEKNQEITDSINYAKRIQYTLLPPESLMTEYLPAYFILFKPKDIVSGDFYWACKRGNYFYLAVCDSTGHGVPGAFMSLLNIRFLNEAINEKAIEEPGEVLNYVREQLIQHISQEGARDGMDATLVKFEVDFTASTADKKLKSQVRYAAAHNPPSLVRDGKTTKQLYNKMPVGRGENMIPFTTHELHVLPGDVLYLHTDGFADQFGGPKGKKFKEMRLYAAFMQMHGLDVMRQHDVLLKQFMEWKGGLEQIDDVCVLGIKF